MSSGSWVQEAGGPAAGQCQTGEGEQAGRRSAQVSWGEVGDGGVLGGFDAADGEPGGASTAVYRPAIATGRSVVAQAPRLPADVDELARARRVQDLDTAAVLPDTRAERRRRLAEPDLEFRAFCARRRLPASSTPQLERAWDAWQAERYQRGEIDQRPGYTDNPFRPG